MMKGNSFPGVRADAHRPAAAVNGTGVGVAVGSPAPIIKATVKTIREDGQ